METNIKWDKNAESNDITKLIDNISKAFDLVIHEMETRKNELLLNIEKQQRLSKEDKWQQ